MAIENCESRELDWNIRRKHTCMNLNVYPIISFSITCQSVLFGWPVFSLPFGLLGATVKNIWPFTDPQPLAERLVLSVGLKPVDLL